MSIGLRAKMPFAFAAFVLVSVLIGVFGITQMSAIK